ncbi:hypothetical protein [Ruegeria sp.]|uniref:hypothetical protein n=1 Tax=Ruegeria sp. TaxID=1879320 RepID=UPI003B5CC9D0
MDVSHVIVAVVALGIGVVIGQNRKRKDADSIFGSVQPPQQSGKSEQGKGDMSAGMRLFASIFLSGWLIAWTAGILMAFSTFASAGGGASLFVFGWLIAAIAGWFWAVYTLWKLVTGRPVKLRGWN